MVRSPNIATGTKDGQDPLDLASIELEQLLSRFTRTVLHPTPEREQRLITCQYERIRVAANLRYAQAVLAKLEQAPPGRRTDTQGHLATQRETLELVADRLEDIHKIAAGDDTDTSDGEDLLGDIIPTPEDSLESSRSLEVPQEDVADNGMPEPETPELPTEPAATSEPRAANDAGSTDAPTPTTEYPTQTTQSLRARPTAPSPLPTAHSTARAALFANRRKPLSPQTTTATAEAILDQQRAEQDAISGSILKMAGALKKSSKSFSATLEADKDLLNAAGASMEKSELSMEAAQGRMGSLRRMTEGKGWWGRMMLYAWVYGLMVALVLLVFVLPKLRF